jgi:hypothetical protein
MKRPNPVLRLGEMAGVSHPHRREESVGRILKPDLADPI